MYAGRIVRVLFEHLLAGSDVRGRSLKPKTGRVGKTSLTLRGQIFAENQQAAGAAKKVESFRNRVMDG